MNIGILISSKKLFAIGIKFSGLNAHSRQMTHLFIILTREQSDLCSTFNDLITVFNFASYESKLQINVRLIDWKFPFNSFRYMNWKRITGFSGSTLMGLTHDSSIYDGNWMWVETSCEKWPRAGFVLFRIRLVLFLSHVWPNPSENWCII